MHNFSSFLIIDISMVCDLEVTDLCKCFISHTFHLIVINPVRQGEQA
jgi:hypothetical protein